MENQWKMEYGQWTIYLSMVGGGTWIGGGGLRQNPSAKSRRLGKRGGKTG